MPEQEWHVVEEVWDAYVLGRLDSADEASVDAHAARCDRCRAAARAHVTDQELEALWRGVQARVGRREPALGLRWLRRLGVPEQDIVVLDAAPGFALPWALAVGGAVMTAFLAAVYPAWRTETFLLLAPLVPVLTVVGAYDATDVLRDLAATTPYSKLRLGLLRTAAALVVAVPTTALVGLVVPGLDALAASWLLPALASTSVALVLFTWCRVWVAFGAVVTGWSAVVLSAAAVHDATVLVGPWGHLACAGLTLLAVGAWARRTDLSTRPRSTS